MKQYYSGNHVCPGSSEIVHERGWDAHYPAYDQQPFQFVLVRQYSSRDHAQGQGEEPDGEYKPYIARGSLKVSQVKWPNVIVESQSEGPEEEREKEET